MKVAKTITVSIIGASGYSGAEFMKILLRHKQVSIEKLFANSSVGKRVNDFDPWFGGRVESVYEQYTVEAACKSDLVFIALPSGESMNIVPELLERGGKIIDLGGDFRFKDASLYEKYYKREQKAKTFLHRAVFGLPEWNRKQIQVGNHMIANPGCYNKRDSSSCSHPKEGIIEPHGITISSLSGVSGAGRSASLDYSFTEVNESVKAYKVGVHQHTPEIKTTLEAISEKSISLTFVPHLLPITRGIYTSIYAPLAHEVTQADVLAAYRTYYRDEPFVRISDTAIPELKNVNYTNYIDIGFRVHSENNQLIIVSALDNLVKGAAGQAVQNMNLMFGFDEREGLLS